jgi:SAM-dependent methyltransferase
VRTDYERLAARYDEDRAGWSVPPDDDIEAMLRSGARRRWRVVDLGCGTARWLVAQAAAFGDAPIDWIGVDPSPAMLAHAAAKGAVALVRAGAEHLPLASGSVDYVASSYAFHHFGDKERALAEVDRLLGPSGAFRIHNLEPTAAHGWWLYECFPEAAATDAVRFWPPDRLRAALEAKGFTVEVRIEPDPRPIPVTEALAEAERRVVSQLALLDDAAYERGLARLRSVAAEGGPDATVTTNTARLQLTARRAREHG